MPSASLRARNMTASQSCRGRLVVPSMRAKQQKVQLRCHQAGGGRRRRRNIAAVQAPGSCMACSLLLKTKRVSSATSTTTRRRVTRALVNVDFGPAMLLGSGMVASGLALYQVSAPFRRAERERFCGLFLSEMGFFLALSLFVLVLLTAIAHYHFQFLCCFVGARCTS